ncbi:MAG TPA: helix-turn-helix transcriptional regulator [Burkholderiales bacterium]
MNSAGRRLTLRTIFATRVRAARLASGYSQEKLAELADLDRTYVSSVERGLRNISIDNIERLCRVLMVTPAQMLSEDD